MIGLDIKISHFDLLLKHLKIGSVYFKCGHIEQFCLKVNSTTKEQSHPSAVFLVLNEPDEAKVMDSLSCMDVVLVSEGKHVVGRGRGNTSVQAKILYPPHSFPDSLPGFLLLNTLEYEIPIDHQLSGKPSIELGLLFVRVNIFDLKATKPCLCVSSSTTTR